MKIFDRTINVLEKALDIRLSRHNLIAANLANMDTPGYRALDFSFEAELSRALAEDPVRIGDLAEPSVVPATMAEGPVDLDRENTRLAENTLNHDALTKLMSKKFDLLKYAISEGGK
ncbi:MAG: flagellar basal body protein [Pseudomonadota bacterium]